jgi:hypothetical protein
MHTSYQVWRAAWRTCNVEHGKAQARYDAITDAWRRLVEAHGQYHPLTVAAYDAWREAETAMDTAYLWLTLPGRSYVATLLALPERINSMGT